MLRSQKLAAVATFAALTLAGCLGQDPERIRVRRDPKLVDQEEDRIRPNAYENWLAEQDEKAERLRLTLELKREHDHYEDIQLRVNAVLNGIHEDPFADYEKDRLDVLYRNWADHDLPPPEPELDIRKSAGVAGPGRQDRDEGDEEDDDDEDDDDE